MYIYIYVYICMYKVFERILTDEKRAPPPQVINTNPQHNPRLSTRIRNRLLTRILVGRLAVYS